MTGFLKDPQKPGTLLEWREGLGSEFEAEQWVRGFKDAGATYLIFYDKWHDGLVNHDTNTTDYKTHRDFVKEIADACHATGLRLVIYFNPHIDGNPDFKQWAVRDLSGAPILMSRAWPFESQSLHSPFRRVAVEQVRELLTGYGVIDGIWLDIFGQRLNTRSEWVTRAYERMYGEPFEGASASKRQEFSLRTLAGYLDDVRGIAEEHQPDCVLTANGAANASVHGGPWGRWVGSRLDYGSTEGHDLERIERLARMAAVSPQPVEVGTLLSSTWFAPNEDEPPPAAKTPRQAIGEVAIAVCQGASVYMALCPSHAGTFGDDLTAAQAAGTWFGAVEEYLAGGEPYADVGIVMGAPAADGPGLPRGNSLWKRYAAAQASAWDEVVAISEGLERAGVFARPVCAWEGEDGARSLSRFRAVVLPELALVDERTTGELAQYVERGGRLVAFGHASMLDGHGNRREDYALAELLGAHYEGEASFPADAYPATVYVDSVYHGQFPGRNLIDDQPTFWASADTPMPHWAQINLADRVNVAKVELVSREGPWLVTDIDVEAYDGQEWRVVESVRGAATKLISVELAEPVSTQHVRVQVLGELEGEQDRQIADVEAIRVFDEAGRNWATDRARRFALDGVAPEVTDAFGEGVPTFAPMAVRVREAGAEALARLGSQNGSPAILRKRVGKGEAVLIATGEAAFRGDGGFWRGVARLLLGEPTYSCDDVERHRVIVTRGRGGQAVHVIDRQVAGRDYEPVDVTVGLRADLLGNPQVFSGVDGGRIGARAEEGLVTLTVRPDPVATVVMR